MEFMPSGASSGIVKAGMSHSTGTRASGITRWRMGCVVEVRSITSSESCSAMSLNSQYGARGSKSGCQPTTCRVSGKPSTGPTIGAAISMRGDWKYEKGDAAAKAAIEAKGIAVVGFAEAVKSTTTLTPDDKPTKDDIVTIMYTSGTTGMPKGVMLTHGNIVATISMIDLSPSLSLLNTDVHLSYLPLAHIFERHNCNGLLYKGAVIYFASQGAKYLLADLGVIRPTIFAGVPKVYENVRDAVNRKMTGMKKPLFEAAEIGRASCRERV